MKKGKILFFLGLWVAILPFLGFPKNFKNILFIATGLGIMYIGYILYHKNKKINPNEMRPFVDNIENEDK
ncbi:MAG: hypothetical protein U9R00_02040 [Patescibacteria group bacterium]|nr:hypothetical protein [Patescibacteria group bacterium]